MEEGPTAPRRVEGHASCCVIPKAEIDENVDRVLAHDARALRYAVNSSVQMQADIVARDETEQGERAVRNLGHTFGHALEAWTGYSARLLHGEGVAVGMCLAFRLSEQLGHCPPQTAAMVSAHIKRAGLPVTIADIEAGLRPAEQTAGFDVDVVSAARAAARITVPVLLVHGADDTDTPPAHSRRIHAALAGPKELILVRGVGHNQALGADIWRRIERFIIRAAARRGGEP